MKTKFKRHLIIALALLLVVLIGKTCLDLRSGFDELLSRHTSTLSSLQYMESDALDGIGEAFSYVVLNDEAEKDEFYENMESFDANALSFQSIAQLQDEELVQEVGAYSEVVASKADLMVKAGNMFTVFEELGVTSSQTVGAFESAVETLAMQLDALVEVEKQELIEHVEEMQSEMTLNFAVLLLLSILLSGVLIKSSRRKI